MIKDGQPIPRSREFELFAQLKNPYFAARFLEISTVVHTLLERGVIDQNNLDDGATDLGTGSGIGLLALRNYTRGPLHGVDNGTYLFDDVNQYCGSYQIPTPEIIEAADAIFVPADNITYLTRLPKHSVSLITYFYVQLDALENLSQVFKAVSRVLRPGGQIIMTTDWMAGTASQTHEWGNPVIWQGDKGPHNRTLLLPFPEKLRLNHGDMIEFAGYYLEDEIHKTKATTMGCVRDRIVMAWTKK